MQIFGILALMADVYLSLMIAASIGAYNPAQAWSLTLIAISTRLAFFIEECFITKFDSQAYGVATAIAIIDMTGVVFSENIQIATAVVTITGIFLILMVPSLKTSRN